MKIFFAYAVAIAFLIVFLLVEFKKAHAEAAQRAYATCVQMSTKDNLAQYSDGKSVDPQMLIAFWNETAKCSSILTPPVYVPPVVLPGSTATGAHVLNAR